MAMPNKLADQNSTIWLEHRVERTVGNISLVHAPKDGTVIHLLNRWTSHINRPLPSLLDFSRWFTPWLSRHPSMRVIYTGSRALPRSKHHQWTTWITMSLICSNISNPSYLDYDLTQPHTQQRLRDLLERLTNQENGISRVYLPEDIEDVLMHVVKGDITYVPDRLTTSQVRQILHPTAVNIWRKNDSKLLELHTIGARLGSPLPMLANGCCIHHHTDPVSNLYNSIQYGFQPIPVSPIPTKDWTDALDSIQRSLYREFKVNHNTYHNVDRVKELPLVFIQGAGTERHHNSRRKQHKTHYKHDKRDP